MGGMLTRPVVAVTAALALGAPLLTTAADAADAAAPGHRPAAAPSTVDLTDAAQDVWVWSEGTMTWELWGTKQDADVLGATVTHGSRAVRVVLQFDNLRKERSAHYVAGIRTKKLVRFAWVDADSSDWAGSHRLRRENGDTVPSPGFRHSISYAKDTVVMRVPRRLLGSPGWIKVSLHNELSGSHEWQDNPHNGEAEPTWTGKIPHA